MKRHHSDHFHTFNLLNMALGALVFAMAVYLMVTGEYADLLLRQHAETLLGRLEIGAPLYVVLFWYLDRLFRPLWYSASAQKY
jgi:hypothetical protein